MKSWMTIEEKQAYLDLLADVAKRTDATGERADLVLDELHRLEAGGVAWAAHLLDDFAMDGARRAVRSWVEKVAPRVTVRERERRTVMGATRRTDAGAEQSVQLSFEDFTAGQLHELVASSTTRLMAERDHIAVAKACLALLERHPASTVGEALVLAGKSLQQWLDTFDAKAA